MPETQRDCFKNRKTDSELMTELSVLDCDSGGAFLVRVILQTLQLRSRIGWWKDRSVRYEDDWNRC